MHTLEILDRLIAFDTTSHRSNMELITYVQTMLQDVGAEVQLIQNQTGEKANLYATIGPGDGSGVMLSGHTDVVPVEGQEWSVPAFQMTQHDGRVYGRGTADMKGFLASALSAALKAAKKPLKTSLHLAFSYDEEIGCVGVRSLIDMLKTAPIRPLFCIVGEPTQMAVATGHKGKIAAQALCHGKTVHSALAPTGVNAIHIATDFINKIRELQDDIKQNYAKDEDYDIPYTTLHVGKIQGGVALNIVPNLCTVDFEIRNLADDIAEAVLDQIKTAAHDVAQHINHPDARIDITVKNTYPGLNTPKQANVVDFVKSLTGANNTLKVAFGTEGGLFDQRLGIPTVICGPGSMEQGHKADEYITLDQLSACDKMLDTLVECLCEGL